MKKYIASAILLLIAASFFLLLMGSEDAAKIKQGFVKMAPWFVFFYITVSIGLNKYKSTSSFDANIGSIVMFAALVLMVLFGRNPDPLRRLSSALGGQILFFLAILDIWFGYFRPRSVKK